MSLSSYVSNEFLTREYLALVGESIAFLAEGRPVPHELQAEIDRLRRNLGLPVERYGRRVRRYSHPAFQDALQAEAAARVARKPHIKSEYELYDPTTALVYADYLQEQNHPAEHVFRWWADPERREILARMGQRGTFVGRSDWPRPEDGLSWSIGYGNKVRQHPIHPIIVHVGWHRGIPEERGKGGGYGRIYAPITSVEASELADHIDRFYGQGQHGVADVLREAAKKYGGRKKLARLCQGLLRYAKADTRHAAHPLIAGFPLEHFLRHLANDANAHPSVREIAKAALTGKNANGEEVPPAHALRILPDAMEDRGDKTGTKSHPKVGYYNLFSAGDALELDSHTRAAFRNHAQRYPRNVRIDDHEERLRRDAEEHADLAVRALDNDVPDWEGGRDRHLNTYHEVRRAVSEASPNSDPEQIERSIRREAWRARHGTADRIDPGGAAARNRRAIEPLEEDASKNEKATRYRRQHLARLCRGILRYGRGIESQPRRYNADAIRGLTEAIHANPEEANNHLVLADLHDEMGNHEEAAFRRAMGGWVARGPRLDFPDNWHNEPEKRVPKSFYEPAQPSPDQPSGLPGGFTHYVHQADLPPWVDGRSNLASASENSHARTIADPAVAYHPNQYWWLWRGYPAMEEGLRRAFHANYRPEQLSRRGSIHRYATADRTRAIAHPLISGFPLETFLRHLANDPKAHKDVRTLSKVALTGKGTKGESVHPSHTLWALHDALRDRGDVTGTQPHPKAGHFNLMSAADALELDAKTHKAILDYAGAHPLNPHSMGHLPAHERLNQDAHEHVYRALVGLNNEAGLDNEHFRQTYNEIHHAASQASRESTPEQIESSIRRHGFRAGLAIADRIDPNYAQARRNRALVPKEELTPNELSSRYRRFALSNKGDFLDSLQKIRSKNITNLAQQAQQIARKLGMSPTSTKPALHDSPWGSVPGVAQAVYGSASPEQIHAAASFQGLQGNIPGVAVFHARPNGPDGLYYLNHTGSGMDVRAKLDRAGIRSRILLPHRTGFGVLIPDPGHRQLKQVQAFAQASGTPLQMSRGYLKQIGSQDQASARESMRGQVVKGATRMQRYGRRSQQEIEPFVRNLIGVERRPVYREGNNDQWYRADRNYRIHERRAPVLGAFHDFLEDEGDPRAGLVASQIANPEDPRFATHPVVPTFRYQNVLDNSGEYEFGHVGGKPYVGWWPRVGAGGQNEYSHHGIIGPVTHEHARRLAENLESPQARQQAHAFLDEHGFPPLEQAPEWTDADRARQQEWMKANPLEGSTPVAPTEPPPEDQYAPESYARHRLSRLHRAVLRYAVVDPQQPQVTLTVPVPQQVQKRPAQPRQQAPAQPEEIDPEQQPAPVQPMPEPTPRAFIFPWSIAPKQKPTQFSRRKLPQRKLARGTR